MEGPDKLFLLVSEEDEVSPQRADDAHWSFGSLSRPFSCFYLRPYFLAMGYDLPVFSGLCAFIGCRKYLLFRQKASKFFTETGLDWDYVISQESKRKQIFFVSLLSLLRSRAFQIVSNVALIWISSLKQFRKCRARFGKNLYLRSYLRNGDLFALSLRLSSPILAGAGLYQAILGCDSGGGSV